jgi:Zn-dependent metalloprotease
MRHAFCCSIVPPHILNHLAESDDRELRQRAREALVLGERMRGERRHTPHFRGVLPSAVKRRSVYDARHTTNLPGVLTRTEESSESTDASVERAFAGAGDTYDFYKRVYGRNSIDDSGLAIDSTVHFGIGFDNAFWNGRQMVYGDGDGRLFGDFTCCLDVIGHELTHGVTQYEAGLVYRGQPGALNESMSDVFGVLVKQWRLGQAARDADWLVGEGLFGPSVHGEALRSMKAPGTAYDDPRLGKDPQPAHMSGFVVTEEDDGGVHINSGIPNHAFYLAAFELGGHAWEKAGAVWYAALTQYLRWRSTFEDAAAATVFAAAMRFGRGSLEEQAVEHAWRSVGVELQALAGIA